MSTGEHEHDHGSPVTTADTAQNAVDDAVKRKLDLDVQIADVGPCKKHLKVVVARPEIDRQFNESIGTMAREAAVPGFRPGRAPKQLVQKRFRKQVAEQVKSTLLMACLEQIDEDYKLNPITQPQLDVEAIELPDDGPMMFEMDLEVRPDFTLPAYKALTVKRPVKTIEDADVDAQLKLFLERHAQMVPKLEGGAAIGDYITADLRFHRDGTTLNEVKEIQFRLQPELRFQDGSVPKVGESLLGVKPGESRDAEAKIGSGSVDPALRGQTIQVTFQVHDLKQLRLPEVDSAFLSGLGFDTEVELRDALREILERRLTLQQRQAVRREILEQLIKETPFDLPADLVGRQEKATLRRLILDMRQEGLNETEIRAREAEIRANAHESTLRGLQEFFILAKIAEVEDIKVEDEDFELEIEAIAARTDESPRRVRAKIEKDGLGDALASQILERKALDRILEYVSYEEVPHVEQQAVETLDQSASSLVASEEGEAETSAADDGSTTGSKDKS
ncbi:trigger factor [Singulisphaera acidiphila]|uniref:Trigger factor n=1 Tax=Singulisphaera acidiphila (strain ATCC BAA-1392 / DSM 18658 / VKM B-2454 / MOB10) TaxID=886293 RepID=L0DBY8_SINAD|nr:trigger factor [Singulisphaera acidiphila]AGA26874.1 trigger factor [Singulisphaera acidiphila DSM 18658]